MADLGRDEFESWMHTLRDDIRGVHERLDGLNGRTRKVETAVAVLEDRGVRTSDPTARKYAGFAVAAGVLVEIIRQVWGAK